MPSSNPVTVNITVDCGNKSAPVVNTKYKNCADQDHDHDYAYKAKKYHNKCYLLIKDLLKRGGRCPSGYEKYLHKFSE